MMSGNMRSHFKEVKQADAGKRTTRQTKKQGPRGEEQPAGTILGLQGPPSQQAESINQNYDLPEEERVLRAFDLATKYGPCTGMTRLERWQRAQKFGLCPPPEVFELLQRLGPQHTSVQPLWAGRV